VAQLPSSVNEHRRAARWPRAAEARTKARSIQRGASIRARGQCRASLGASLLVEPFEFTRKSGAARKSFADLPLCRHPCEVNGAARRSFRRSPTAVPHTRPHFRLHRIVVEGECDDARVGEDDDDIGLDAASRDGPRSRAVPMEAAGRRTSPSMRWPSPPRGLRR
jgi:hypothetical protein